MCCIAKIVSFKINNYGYCNNAFLGKDQILVGFDYYGYIDDPLRIVAMVSTGIGIRGVISVVRVAFDSFWNCSAHCIYWGFSLIFFGYSLRPVEQ